MYILNEDSYATITSVRGYPTRMGVHFTNMRDSDTLSKLFLFNSDSEVSLAIAKTRAFVVTNDWFRDFVLTFDLECQTTKANIGKLLDLISRKTRAIAPEFDSELSALIAEVESLPN